MKDDRQLAEDFYFLDPDQEAIIKKFWQEFLPTSTKTQEQFIDTWKILQPVYEAFKNRLKALGVGYTSFVYRELALNLDKIKLPKNKPLIFAGFNVFTPAEEALIKHFVLTYDAEVLWDIDGYYLDNEKQEAGEFLRRYRQDRVLGKSFPTSLPQRIKEKKDVCVTGVSLEVGQAKLIGEEVEKLLESGAKEGEIVIILPQDYMLFPVLNSIPDRVTKLNVTMGYPLKETPLFGLLEAAVELQEHASLSPDNGLSFYHKPTVDILSHPYLYTEERSSVDRLLQEIKRKNKIRIYQQEISSLQPSILAIIFRQINDHSKLASYLQEIVVALGEQVVERFGLEKEYLYHF